MTHTEILQKAIEKAVANGYAPTDSGKPVIEFTSLDYGAWFYEEDGTGVWQQLFEIIYDKDFAKALWGETPMWNYNYEKLTASGENKGLYRCFNWQYHLQMMVVSEDPIAYLNDHI